MWIRILLMFAPTIENLLQSLLGVAAKSVDTHQAAAGTLASQASQLMAKSDAHLTQADQAKKILSALQGLVG